jgi:hypothetical protein
MGLIGYLKPLWFFAAFALGLVACYVIAPTPTVVVKFPSPFNAGKITYKDEADTCFTFKSDKVTCPTDESKIKKQPLLVNIK